MLIRLIVLLTLVVAGTNALAGSVPPQPATVAPAAGEPTIDDLLNMEITAASAKPSLPSEAPAVVSVITREEIEKSGARDIIDVLRMVPGFEFGVDVFNIVGPGFRGLWGHDGKIKLAVDGLSFNDLLFGNVPYGNHFPVELIERIEIVRGPGSAMYGNFAELAVINIITKTGAEVTGLQASSTTGFFDNGFARENLTARYGKTVGTNGFLGLSLFGGLAHSSNRTYIDQDGNPWDMKGNSDLQTANLEIAFRKGGLSAGFIYDNYRITHRDSYGSVIPFDAHSRFVSYLGRVSYRADLTDSLSLTPTLKVAVQQPWRNTGVAIDDPNYYDPTVQQYILGLDASWDLSARTSTIVGSEYEFAVARHGGNEPSRNYLFPGGAQQTDYSRYALYNEWLFKTAIANITAGLRLESHADYGYSLVPRLSLTRTLRDISVKAIYNRAFRAPSIEQTSTGLKAGQQLKTETSDNYELEIGYRIDAKQNVTVNGFYIDMHNPIVYFHDPVRDLDTYVNQGNVSTAGAELEYRYHDIWGHLILRYAYYRAIESGADLYRIPNRDDMFLAFPSHKATLDVGYRLTQDLNLNTTLIFVGDRFGFDHIDPGTGEAAVRRFNPELVTNLFLLYKNAIWRGVDVGVGVFDLFGTNHKFIQPFNGGHAPLPGPGREYLLRISYTPGIS